MGFFIVQPLLPLEESTLHQCFPGTGYTPIWDPGTTFSVIKFSAHMLTIKKKLNLVWYIKPRLFLLKTRTTGSRSLMKYNGIDLKLLFALQNSQLHSGRDGWKKCVPALRDIKWTKWTPFCEGLFVLWVRRNWLSKLQKVQLAPSPFPLCFVLFLSVERSSAREWRKLFSSVAGMLAVFSCVLYFALIPSPTQLLLPGAQMPLADDETNSGRASPLSRSVFFKIAVTPWTRSAILLLS